MSVRNHDSILRICREEAERYGWRAEAENVGIDPLDIYFGRPKTTPGRGDISISRGETGAVVSFEYELPESESDIRSQVRAIVMSDQQDVDRRVNPRLARAIEV